MRGALAAVVAFALALSGCPDPPPAPPPFDAGFFPPPRDGGHADGPDTFRWPDTGPPLPDVVPAQSWIIDCMVGADTFELTLDVDARAEAGIVRAVGGAGGRAASVIFDIMPGGILRARGPIPMGIAGDHACSYDEVTIDQWLLQFDDPDGDGIRDHLASAASASTITRSGPTMPGFPSAEFVYVRTIVPDTQPPILALEHDAPIPRFDPVVLRASEPVDPAFMARLVGPRTLGLVADIGASAPARWSLDTRSMPAGRYTLEAAPAHDLAGLGAATIPTLVVDVPELARPAIDGCDPSVVGVLSSAPAEIFGDDVGETALEGTTSLLLRDRAVLVFDSTAGRRTLSMTMRLEAPADTFNVVAFVTVFDENGANVGQVTNYQSLLPPATVPGFEVESPPAPVSVGYLATRAGRYYALIEPPGPRDVSCTGIVPGVGVGAVIDQIALF